MDQDRMSRCELQPIFKRVVAKVWGADIHCKNEICSDASEGEIGFLQRDEDFRHDEINDRTIKQSRNVVLVLESPHRDEFQPNGRGRMGPANGTTGKRIRACLNEYLHSQFQDWNLVLVNAVQFQCSLGQLRSPKEKYQKNRVFELMFNDEHVRDCFRCRMRLFNLNRDLFVVATGKGNSGKNIDRVVASVLEEITSRVVCVGNHPSRWPNYRKGNEIDDNFNKKLQNLTIE